MKTNTTKVHLFIKSMSETERLYIVHALEISNSIRKLIKETGISKCEFNNKFRIPSRLHNDFINGAFDYDLKRIAILNCWFAEIEMNNIENKVPVQIKSK